MRRRMNRNADGIDVFLNRRTDNFRCAVVNAEINHFDTGIAESLGDDFYASIVAVETDFAEEYTQVMVSGSHANHLIGLE
jgi:hypothetical protein